MSPRYPSTDPRTIRAALAYAETHSRNATAQKFSINHHSVQRWIDYRAEHGVAWPTDQDVAEWDAKAPQRARIRREQVRYLRRIQSNGGPLMRSPHGTIRRLQALCAIGWTQGQLATRLGVSRSRVSRLIITTRVGVMRETAQNVANLYDELWDVIPVGREANRARNEATRKGWCSPLAWDDDAIDDPNAQPVGLKGRYIVGDYIDEAAVLRRMAGERVDLTKAERIEVVRRLRAAHWTYNQIEEHTGLKTDRYIAREKAAA